MHRCDTYITDVPYPAHFHREMLPAWLHTTLTAAGYAAPTPNAPFRMLELGCGIGINTLVSAACHPQAETIGIDLSSREVAQAQLVASAAALTNARFECEDLRDTAQRALAQPAPDCDYIVCHGLYSWVEPNVQDALHTIIAHRLKPGGIVYLGYMCQPGSAAFGAAQKLMHLHADRASGDSAQRARSAVQLVQALASGGAGYFVEHPSAQREIQRLTQEDDAYLAHEFLNRSWHAHHVAEVMARFAQSDCDYTASATPIENIDAVSLPAGVQPIIDALRRQGAGTPEIETAKDIARNQNQRRDIYQKREPQGHRACLLSAQQHRHALLTQRVVLLPSADLQQLQTRDPAATLTLATRIGPVQLPLHHVRPMLQALREGARTYAELAQLPSYQANPGFINQLLQVLAWAGWLRFAHHDNPAMPARMARLTQALEDLVPASVQQQLSLLMPRPD
ncbi:class I SAM-dependent methyltransferase [Lampropedia cohaerens]|uniref:class I SAM-dependent methyltransferase n=1 Tax=Lampropedia cohaerens TaxID=1610491 RepID=UPI00069AB952|nr:class I SAM-dependent methyltransferase [Lampropedia cohaerens]